MDMPSMKFRHIIISSMPSTSWMPVRLFISPASNVASSSAELAGAWVRFLKRLRQKVFSVVPPVAST